MPFKQIDKFDLKETDYFILSTNTEQIFKENIKLFNICGKKNNETFIKSLFN